MAKRPSTPPPSQSEVDKAIQHAMDAAASRRERIAMLGGGQKRKDVPRIPGATGHMKVSPEGKQKKKGPESLERDHGADPVVRKLFDDAPAEEAPHVEPAQATLSDSQGDTLARGMSSATTLPADEDELEAYARAVALSPQTPSSSRSDHAALHCPPHVDAALRLLAANPVLQQNPKAIGDFIKALVSQSASPTPEPTPTPTPEPTAQLTPKPKPDDVPTETPPDGKLKAFWSKFKAGKKHSVDSQETLCLGDLAASSTYAKKQRTESATAAPASAAPASHAPPAPAIAAPASDAPAAPPSTATTTAAPASAAPASAAAAPASAAAASAAPASAAAAPASAAPASAAPASAAAAPASAAPASAAPASAALASAAPASTAPATAPAATAPASAASAAPASSEAPAALAPAAPASTTPASTAPATAAPAATAPASASTAAVAPASAPATVAPSSEAPAALAPAAPALASTAPSTAPPAPAAAAAPASTAPEATAAPASAAPASTATASASAAQASTTAPESEAPAAPASAAPTSAALASAAPASAAPASAVPASAAPASAAPASAAPASEAPAAPASAAPASAAPASEAPAAPASAAPASAAPASEAPAPASAAPASAAPASEATAVPADPASQTTKAKQNIAETLTRLTTVDLEKGARPAGSVTGNSAKSTAVLLNLNGIDQPVFVPLSPTTAKAAGLRLVSDMEEEAAPSDPCLATSAGEDPDPADRASKALYMKFYRSLRSKFVPEEVKARYAELTSKGRKASKEERMMMFEEFLQCDGEWQRSSIVVNARSERNTKKKGTFKLFSREDLMQKYHNKSDVVDEICRTKAEQQQTQRNPDFPDMELFWCWDASAESVEEVSSNSITVSKAADVDNKMAGSLMQNPHLLSTSAPSGLDMAAATPASQPPTEGEKGGNPKGGKPKAGGKKKEQVPKPKTAFQEAKAAMGQASALILECKSWDAKLSQGGTPDVLRKAAVQDMDQYALMLEKARSGVEASITSGANDEDMARATQALAQCVSSYKVASKHVKGLGPKAPKQAKAKAAP